MKLAVLADAHANLPAVEAVLADARDRGAAAVWFLGDFVGYGPFPEQTVALLRARAQRSIRGNYDRKVLAFEENKDAWRRTKPLQKYISFRWTYESLSTASLAYLASLPAEVRRTVAGVRALLVHASPARDDEALGPHTPPTRLKQLAARARADVVLCGHTHEAFDIQAARTRFLNPGSVGRPEGDDPRAAYAMVTFARGAVQAELLRVLYDVERTVAAVRALGLPEEFQDMFRTGRNLDDVRRAPRAASPAPTAARPRDRRALQAVIELARRCRYEAPHTHQVTRLALELFDALRSAHGYGHDERHWLQCGAMLHDIGWAQGRKGHHRMALRRIRRDTTLPLDARSRRLVALIARYHRKALPRDDHEAYRDLDGPDRERVWVLGGLLRLADALDRSHLALVTSVQCQVAPKHMVVSCRARAAAGPEAAAARKKACMLARALHRSVRVVVRGPACPHAGGARTEGET